MTRLVGIHQRPPDCLQIHTSGRKRSRTLTSKVPARCCGGMIVSAAMQAPVEETFTWLRRARKA